MFDPQDQSTFLVWVIILGTASGLASLGRVYALNREQQKGNTIWAAIAVFLILLSEHLIKANLVALGIMFAGEFMEWPFPLTMLLIIGGALGAVDILDWLRVMRRNAFIRLGLMTDHDFKQSGETND